MTASNHYVSLIGGNMNRMTPIQVCNVVVENKQAIAYKPVNKQSNQLETAQINNEQFIVASNEWCVIDLLQASTVLTIYNVIQCPKVKRKFESMGLTYLINLCLGIVISHGVETNE